MVIVARRAIVDKQPVTGQERLSKNNNATI